MMPGLVLSFIELFFNIINAETLINPPPEVFMEK
jgi:hypothetical protein